MKLGGKMMLTMVDAHNGPSSPQKEVVLPIYSNRITLLPLAAEDNGMDKENRTNTGHCHSAQLTLCSPQAYLSSLSLRQCRPQ